MKQFVDQIGREIEWKDVASDCRIVSLVPSLTELLFTLNLGQYVSGVTRYCVHPQPMPRGVQIIGGTKDPDLDKIKALKPHLIIANKEENHRSDVEDLAKYFTVYVSDINQVDDLLSFVKDLGLLCGRTEEAERFTAQICSMVQELRQSHIAIKRPNILYLIWRRPWMGVANDTWIHHILTDVLALNNALNDHSRYPVLTETDLKALNPEVILLSSEPYPFKARHAAELQSILPNTRIIFVDGEIFSWYGPRLLALPTVVDLLDQESST